MKIKSFEFQELKIPFKVGFKHSSADRRFTQTILVKVQSDSGYMGVGEGCPREYVSGENMASCREFIQSIKEEVINFSDLEHVSGWANQHEKRIDQNPAAWCAVELAILDLWGREGSISIEELLSLPELEMPFKYTAVLGDSSPEDFEKQVRQFVKYGFWDFKVKITGDINKDQKKMGIISKHCTGDHRIRLDGNNLWKQPAEVIKYLKDLGNPIFALEEPLTAFDFVGLRKIAKEFPTKIILDESFLNQGHFADLEKDPDPYIINLRISKMGGLYRSLKIGHCAAKLNIPLIIGAQVGETSVLTRAALAIAQNFKEILLAQEGAFGTLLLSRDLVQKPLMFGAGGILSPGEHLQRELGGFQLSYNFT